MSNQEFISASEFCDLVTVGLMIHLKKQKQALN